MRGFSMPRISLFITCAILLCALLPGGVSAQGKAASVTAPHPELRSGSTQPHDNGAWVSLSWSGGSDGPVAGFALQESIDGNPFKDVARRHAISSVETLWLTSGTTYQF